MSSRYGLRYKTLANTQVGCGAGLSVFHTPHILMINHKDAALLLQSKILLVVLLSLASASIAMAQHEPMPTEGWFVNNWRKNDATAEWSIVQAPDDTPAIEIMFKGKTGPNVVSPDITDLAKNWPVEFGALSFYCHGDGSGQRLAIQLLAGANKYTASLILSHTGWKRVKVENMWTPAGTPPLVPNQITRYVISAPDSCNVAIGALKFAVPGVPMDLTPGNTGYAVRTSQPPTIDGILDEPMWSRSPWLETTHTLRESMIATGKARFRIAFDQDNLYLAAQVRQDPGMQDVGPNFTGEGAQVWRDESVEVFINPKRDVDTHYHLMVNRVNTTRRFAHHFNQVADAMIRDANWDWGDATSVTVNGEDQWTTEWKIPWSSIGAKGPSGQIFLQLMHNDWHKATQSEPDHTVWSPAKGKPMNGWGVLNLIDAPSSNRSVLQVSEIQLDRIALGKYRFVAHIKHAKQADSPLGNLQLDITLAGPSRQLETWQHEVQTDKPTFTYTGELTADSYSSGLHRLSVRVASTDAPSTVPGGAIASFSQEIPVDVAYGDTVLCPAPKQMTQGQGEFSLTPQDRISITDHATARTRKTATLLADRLYGHFGIKPAVVDDASRTRIHMSIQPDAVRDATGQSNVKEAYILRVTQDDIELIGGGEAGLYYAVVTLNQLARVPHQPKAPIQATHIIDWPSISQRIYAERFSTNMRRVNEAPDLERYKQTLERVVAGGKFNVFVFTLDRNFAFQKHPELTVHPTVNAEQVREICDWAREHFIEVIPATLYGSHSNWISISGFEDMIEPGYSHDQLDVTHPNFVPVMQDIVSEILDAAGPETKRFMIQNDEWWHVQKRSPTLTHNGLTRQELLLKALLAEYEFLKSRGVQMVMFTDMIDPNHNGGAPFHLSQIAEDLPRDIIMYSWSNSSPRWLKEMGFTTMKVNNNFILPRRDLAEYIDGFGTIAYWLQHSTFNYVDNQKSLAYSWHATLRAADYAWNIGNDSNLSREEWSRWRMSNLMPNFGLDDVPLAGEVISMTLPDDATLDNQLGIVGTHTIGGLDMQFNPNEVNANAMRVELPTPTLAASAILVHGVRFVDDAARDDARKDALHRVYAAVKVGDVVFHYEDGSTAAIDLRLGVNTIDTAAPALSRYVLFNGRDLFEFGNQEALLQSEWVNPHPNRKVVAISMTATRSNAPLLWAGLTLRGIAQ